MQVLNLAATDSAFFDQVQGVLCWHLEVDPGVGADPARDDHCIVLAGGELLEAEETVGPELLEIPASDLPRPPELQT